MVFVHPRTVGSSTGGFPVGGGVLNAVRDCRGLTGRDWWPQRLKGEQPASRPGRGDLRKDAHVSTTRLALSALLLAAAGVVAPAGAQAVTMAGTDSVAPECVTHSDSVNTGRAAAGSNRRDPHELSAAQTTAMEADLARRAGCQGASPAPRRRSWRGPLRPGPRAAFADRHGRRLRPRHHRRRGGPG